MQDYAIDRLFKENDGNNITVRGDGKLVIRLYYTRPVPKVTLNRIEMSGQQDIKETFKDIQQLTQEALTEMRALIWQLRPRGLESGLMEAIKVYAEMLNIKLTVNVSGVIQFPSRIEETLFRISQEALNNVRRHSGVTAAELYIKVTATDVLLVVKDAGRGFKIEAHNEIPSLGMQSIKDRAHAVGGTADWVSEIGKGTEILIRLPY